MKGRQSSRFIMREPNKHTHTHALTAWLIPVWAVWIVLDTCCVCAVDNETLDEQNQKLHWQLR